MSKVYVGTYRKYNEGSLAGDWLDLTDYSSKKDFIEACLELHDDEKDPELMFQDWEDIPADFIGESSIDEKVWEWLELSEDDRETVAMYREDVNFNAPIEEALECYQGEFDSEEDWAVDYWEQTGMLSEVPEQVQSYIDYEKFARDAQLGGDMTFVRKGHRVRAFRRY
jgi:antirestriction protein